MGERLLCRIGLHHYGLVRRWWEGSTICALYACALCSRQHIGKKRT